MATYIVNGNVVEAPNKTVALLKVVGVSVALAKQIGIRCQRYNKTTNSYVQK